MAHVLFSTAPAPAGSAAGLVTKDRSWHDVKEAQKKLERVAEAAGNSQLAPFYERFLALDGHAWLNLLNRVTILDDASRAVDLTEGLKIAVRKTVPAKRRMPPVERLRGWWHGRTIDHLNSVASGIQDWIGMIEVETQPHRIAQSLRDENLPLDYGDHPEPTPHDRR